jgi:hypothetical protein
MKHDFKFTFEMHEDYQKAAATGYIDTFDIVRICRKSGEDEEGYSIDYPCKSREEFDWNVDRYESTILEMYQAKHYYDVMDYA